MLAYNLLRWLGQNRLIGPDSPKRSPAKGQRLKTLMLDSTIMRAGWREPPGR